MDNMNRIIEMAARDLPEGYTIEISIERGSAWASLCDPHFTVIHEAESMRLEDQVLECIDFANQCAIGWKNE
jgi:hypothetical protein